MLKKKIWANFQRIIELFTQKIVTKLSKIRVWYPRSRIRKKPILNPGSRGQKGPGSGSATLVLSCFDTRKQAIARALIYPRLCQCWPRGHVISPQFVMSRRTLIYNPQWGQNLVYAQKKLLLCTECMLQLFPPFPPFFRNNLNLEDLDESQEEKEAALLTPSAG